MYENLDMEHPQATKIKKHLTMRLQSPTMQDDEEEFEDLPPYDTNANFEDFLK
jgi:hypothetical protein